MTKLIPKPAPKPDEKVMEQKKPRGIVIKDASFVLYKKDKDDGKLSQIGVFETEADIQKAYGKALDEGIPQEQLEGHRRRVLRFNVREIERRIKVS